ncbi:Uncharacterised protein [Mycobacteroides abscessus]|nr:Uncharacterised protein [Mycobacteroides abscessus]
MTGANRFWIALAVGIIAGALTGSVLARWQVALLAVVIVTAVINVVWSLIVLGPWTPIKRAPAPAARTWTTS